MALGHSNMGMYLVDVIIDIGMLMSSNYIWQNNVLMCEWGNGSCECIFIISKLLWLIDTLGCQSSGQMLYASRTSPCPIFALVWADENEFILNSATQRAQNVSKTLLYLLRFALWFAGLLPF